MGTFLGVSIPPRASDEATARRMKAVRLHGSAPELRVRKAFSALGVRYRLNDVRFPGSPDLCNARRKIAVFVHGCFWHRHAGCPRATTPRRNRQFWLTKFEANRRRDRAKASALRRLGFKVLTIWECEAEREQALVRKVARYLKSLGDKG